jgi:hypothetical protein
MLPAASESAIQDLHRVRDGTTVLVMTSTGSQPEGRTSPLRRYLEHPPAAEDLERELDACAALPVRGAR